MLYTFNHKYFDVRKKMRRYLAGGTDAQISPSYALLGRELSIFIDVFAEHMAVLESRRDYAVKAYLLVVVVES